MNEQQERTAFEEWYRRTFGHSDYSEVRRHAWKARSELGALPASSEPGPALVHVVRSSAPRELTKAQRVAIQFYADNPRAAEFDFQQRMNGTPDLSASDGYRTSADRLTRTKIAPHAAASMVASDSVTLRLGGDGRLRPADEQDVAPLRCSVCSRESWDIRDARLSCDAELPSGGHCKGLMHATAGGNGER